MTVRYSRAGGSPATEVAVTLFEASSNARIMFNRVNGMAAGDRVYVRFYNVQVETLGATDLDDDPDPASDGMLDYKSAMLLVTDSLSPATPYSAAIKVNSPMKSIVVVMPETINSEDRTNVTVSYEAQSMIPDGGGISIDLPRLGGNLVMVVKILVLVLLFLSIWMRLRK